jgi:hypothetical protein
MVIASSTYLLSQPLLLACDIGYLLGYLLKVSIVIVLPFKGPNSPPSCFPNNIWADRDIDYHNLW